MNKELQLQIKLREGTSLTKLKDEYGLISKRSELYPELYLFKYDQIRSPMTELIVQESRGVILNSKDNWNVVSLPYKKFFNYGESNAATLNLNTTKVFDKADGSLIQLYFYNDKWNVATSGNPDAAGEVFNIAGTQLTFKELFENTWNNLGYKLPPIEYKEYTFLFELVGPLNRIVVAYKENNIYLHGVINKNTYFEELDIQNIGTLLNYKCVNNYSFSNINTTINQVNKLDPLKNEGFILVDDNFNRVKIKSDSYVQLHHVRSNMSSRAMLEIVRKNEGSEFLNYFPEYSFLYFEVKNKFESLFNYINKYYLEWLGKKILLESSGEILDRKDVGLYFKQHFFCGIMFRLLYDDVNLKDILSEMSIYKLEKWLEEIK